MHDLNTPMIQQYKRIKDQYQDCLLFYRMGDFYELFFEDAKIGSQVLNITLTGKSNGKSGRIPMAGVPYHAADSYLTKLVQAGFKVAICEQMSPPNKKGLVDREVIRVVTPGTMLDEKALSKKENNYIISLYIESSFLGISVADISTGFFATEEIGFENLEQTMSDKLAKLEPSECILSDELYNNQDILKILKKQKGLNIFPFRNWTIFADDAEQVLKKHFSVATLHSFAIEEKPLALKCAAALLGYLQQTQKSQISHIKKLSLFGTGDFVLMDRSTIINLELFSTIREHDIKGSLLYSIDQTITAMGGRLLKDWILKPLRDKNRIDQRLSSVEFLLNNSSLRSSIRELLKEVSDIERLISRLCVGLGNARDLVNLKNSLNTVSGIKEKLQDSKNLLLVDINNQISQEIHQVIQLINYYIVEEPPIALKEGKIINKGVDEKLDKLHDIVFGSKDWMTDFEKQEKDKTGINSLKVRFNKIFGFYIEISNSNLHLVPKNYIRKQTLVNGERFITEELKKHEEIILTAEEKINELEYQIFTEVLEKILKFTNTLQEASSAIAQIDCLSNFAFIAEKYNYEKPKIIFSGELKIKGSRHPVVEKLLDETQFVPNDIHLDNIKQQMLLITGPNMAGKSVLIRQVALIVLLAHIGCFVPAHSAHISLVDRIFVRSGASDVITSGLSTFMVEMVETAHILHNATNNSLVIMDEIGRGTSTYDGISVAWAVAEHLVSTKNPPKILFATHYHELQALESQFPNKIKNYHMAVENDNGDPVFLYTLLPEGASSSFGVEVAKLAGIPESVIAKARQILARLEKRDIENNNKKISTIEYQSPSFSLEEHIIIKELELLDLYQMTPIEALNKLAELKNKLKLFKENSKPYLQTD